MLIRHIIITVIFLVLVVVAIVLHTIVAKYSASGDGVTTRVRDATINPSLIFTTNGITNEQTVRSNCDVETVYSMNDDHCRQVCSTFNIDDGTDNNTYVSRHGVCLNMKTIQLQSDIAATANECNPKNGVLAYVTGNTQFGNLRHYCLSIDIGVQPDDGSSTAANTLCLDGTIDIDYTKSFPQLSNCKCKDDEFVALIPGTSTIRSRGACVKLAAQKIYELGGLVYTAVK